MSNLQINTRVRRLFQYLEDFERGKIQVPPFQRDFVWDNPKKLELLDSLKNGFPIGSVLFWQAGTENLFLEGDIQKIGSYNLPLNRNDFYFILDGYQRLSTLFGCFIDPNRTDLERDVQDWKQNFDIVYNLQEDRFEFNRRVRSEIQIFQIPLYHFIDGEKFYDFQTDLVEANVDESLKKEYIRRYKNFGARVSGYDLPSIDLVGGDIKDAVEIFSRLNSRGVQISDDWKVSALSFNRERNFRFGSEIDNLFQRLSRYNFFNASQDQANKRDLILKCVVNSFGKIYFDISSVSNELEQLAQRIDFIDVSKAALKSIEKAVKFLYEELLVVNSSLLPYNSHLIFITEFFNRVANPSTNQISKLKKWFWQTTYSNYFTIYNLAKQRTAYYQFQSFIDNEDEDPIYYDKGRKFETIDFPKKISMKSVRAKALALFMINYAMRENSILSAEAYIDNIPAKIHYLKIFNIINGEDGANITENTLSILNPEPYTIVAAKNGNLFDSSEITHENAAKLLLPFPDSMFDNQRDYLLVRLNLIKKHEQDFVEELDLIYSRS